MALMLTGKITHLQELKEDLKIILTNQIVENLMNPL